MWYIGTSEDCEAYLNKVNEKKQYHNRPDSVTRTWAEVGKHATEESFCIPVCQGVYPDDEERLTFVDQLPEDWYVAPNK